MERRHSEWLLRGIITRSKFSRYHVPQEINDIILYLKGFLKQMRGNRGQIDLKFYTNLSNMRIFAAIVPYTLRSATNQQLS